MTVQAENIAYSANGTALEGYLAYDDSIEGPRPGVLVVHEWWGLDDYIRSRARMLAQLGYTALAVDMYGTGKRADSPDDAAKYMNEVFADLPAGEKRFAAALELLQSQATTDAATIAAIGYCFGGAIVLHSARIGLDLKGVVSFHGALGSFHKPAAGDVKARVLVCHGAADALVPDEDVTKFKAEMDEAQANYEFINYTGALHGFSNPEATERGKATGLPVAYDADTDAQSWQAMQDLFGEVLA